MRVEPIYITWLNYLGGFEYFLFTGEKDYQVDITESGTVRKNIFQNWPQSYGQTADTIDKQTYIKAKDQIIVRSQFLTVNQRDALKHIKTSPVVQIVVSRTDRRTVLVDKDSFKLWSEDQKVFNIQFTITYTNDIQSQSV